LANVVAFTYFLIRLASFGNASNVATSSAYLIWWSNWNFTKL